MESTAISTGIIVYSRSGHSTRLATRLATELQGALIEIHAPVYEGTLLGYARAGFDSLRQNCVLDPQSLSSLSEFDHVVLCGPVWTSYPAVPLRGVLRGAITLPDKVSLFLTSGAHSPAQKAFAAGEADLGRPFAVTASLPNSAERSAHEERLIAQFKADFLAAQSVTCRPAPTN